jgi:hypothetical protein
MAINDNPDDDEVTTPLQAEIRRAVDDMVSEGLIRIVNGRVECTDRMARVVDDRIELTDYALAWITTAAGRARYFLARFDRLGIPPIEVERLTATIDLGGYDVQRFIDDLLRLGVRVDHYAVLADGRLRLEGDDPNLAYFHAEGLLRPGVTEADVEATGLRRVPGQRTYDVSNTAGGRAILGALRLDAADDGTVH